MYHGLQVMVCAMLDEVWDAIHGHVVLDYPCCGVKACDYEISHSNKGVESTNIHFFGMFVVARSIVSGGMALYPCYTLFIV